MKVADFLVVWLGCSLLFSQGMHLQLSNAGKIRYFFKIVKVLHTVSFVIVFVLVVVAQSFQLVYQVRTMYVYTNCHTTQIGPNDCLHVYFQTKHNQLKVFEFR